MFAEKSWLTKVSITPLKLVAPLLIPDFLSPRYTYALIKVRAVAIQMLELVNPLVKWIIGKLKGEALGLNHLGLIDL